MSEKTTNSVRRLTAIVLVLIVVAVVFSLIACRQFHNRPVATPCLAAAGAVVQPSLQPSLVSSYEGKYYYAGQPRLAPEFRDQILVLTNIGYIVGYDERKKDPAWVCYRLFKINSMQAPPRPGKFERDRRTSAMSVSSDYTGTGYDRGHMAPNFAIAVCYGVAAQAETFLMSNIIPQKPNLNRKAWMYLEQKEIREYAQQFNNIFVMTGPIFDKSAGKLSPGENIPSACYKIMIDATGGNTRMLAFIMPQDITGREPLESFLTSVDNIENRTGLDFCPDLAAGLQAKLEAETAGTIW